MTRRPLLVLLFIAILLSTTQAAIAECNYTILDVATVSGTDPNGTTWSYTTTYYGWLCTDGYLGDERPGLGDGGGDPAPGTDPPTGGCSVNMCQANCDLSYEATIAGEFVESPTGGPTWYKCGPLCVDLATADRNACYGFCVEDCN